MRTMPERPNNSRSVVVLLIVICFCFLGFETWRATEHPPQHGLRVNQTPQGMIITWVQPAGLAWDDGIRPGGCAG
jgi:hypothetical protein